MSAVMLFWIEALAFSLLLGLLAAVLLRNRSLGRYGEELLGEYLELKFQHEGVQDNLFQTVAAFCRSDFIGRKLFVKVEVYQDEDDSKQRVVEGRAAPYGTPGSYWTFGATSCVRDGKSFACIWIVAEPNGYLVRVANEFQQGRDDEYVIAMNFIELALAKHDPFKAYPHEESTAVIEAFFGKDAPCYAVSCFGDAHVRSPSASG